MFWHQDVSCYHRDIHQARHSNILKKIEDFRPRFVKMIVVKLTFCPLVWRAVRGGRAHDEERPGGWKCHRLNNTQAERDERRRATAIWDAQLSPRGGQATGPAWHDEAEMMRRNVKNVYLWRKIFVECQYAAVRLINLNITAFVDMINSFWVEINNSHV